MTEGFQTVLVATERERRDLFLATANRLGTAELPRGSQLCE
jgi:hypothetical protein